MPSAVAVERVKGQRYPRCQCTHKRSSHVDGMRYRPGDEPAACAVFDCECNRYRPSSRKAA